MMKHAIPLALHDSLKLRGRPSWRVYLLFLTAAMAVCGAAVARDFALTGPDAFARSAASIAALAFLPVTIAGARRLQNSGKEGMGIFLPLLTFAAALFLCQVVAGWIGTALATAGLIALLFLPYLGLFTLFVFAIPLMTAHAIGMTPDEFTTLLFTLSIITATLAAMIPFTHIAGQLVLSGQTGPNRYGAQPSKVLL